MKKNLQEIPLQQQKSAKRDLESYLADRSKPIFAAHESDRDYSARHFQFDPHLISQNQRQK